VISDEKILAVVPARGGCKGVPLKNIKLSAGRPLIAHIARVVQQVSWIDHAVVSTDHEQIARVAIRLPEDIDSCIDKLVADGHDAAWIVSPIDLKIRPLKVLRISDDKLDLWDNAAIKSSLGSNWSRSIIATASVMPSPVTAS
jgi:CMP-N,N'-diacetyllegionaminic acid synthase